MRGLVLLAECEAKMSCFQPWRSQGEGESGEAERTFVAINLGIFRKNIPTPTELDVVAYPLTFAKDELLGIMSRAELNPAKGVVAYSWGKSGEAGSHLAQQ